MQKVLRLQKIERNKEKKKTGQAAASELAKKTREREDKSLRKASEGYLQIVRRSAGRKSSCGPKVVFRQRK